MATRILLPTSTRYLFKNLTFAMPRSPFSYTLLMNLHLFIVAFANSYTINIYQTTLDYFLRLLKQNHIVRQTVSHHFSSVCCTSQICEGCILLCAVKLIRTYIRAIVMLEWYSLCFIRVKYYIIHILQLRVVRVEMLFR